jgi:hypothetical protein
VVDESSGFLGRWAKRKAQAREGKPLEEPVRADKVPEPERLQAQTATVAPRETSAQPVPVQPDAPVEAPPALTLDDARALTKDSNFKPFMAQQVQPEVRNAAMKKLFADPQFNVMDGLDIYIDDYTKFDPIPESMLRQMVGAKLLNLFDEAPKEPSSTLSRESADDSAAQTVAQSTISPEAPIPAHDNPHLRLQSDHAAQSPGSGSGTS